MRNRRPCNITGVRTGVGRLMARGAAVVHVASTAAWAQEPCAFTEGNGAFPWLITAGLLLLIAVSAFLNPKRTHMD